MIFMTDHLNKLWKLHASFHPFQSNNHFNLLQESAKNLPSSCTSTQQSPELVSFLSLGGIEENTPLIACVTNMKGLNMQCFFPQYVVPTLRTPLFILNAAYDSWQVNFIPFQHIARLPLCRIGLVKIDEMNSNKPGSALQIRNILAPSAADKSKAWAKCKLDIKNCSSSQLVTLQS
jgi:hypothetical protein